MLGRRRCRCVRDVVDQRVPARRADWMASRCAAVRHRCWSVVAVIVPHAAASVRQSWCAHAGTSSTSDCHSRDLAGAAVGVRDDRRVSKRIRAPDSARIGVAILHHVSNVARLEHAVRLKADTTYNLKRSSGERMSLWPEADQAGVQARQASRLRRPGGSESGSASSTSGVRCRRRRSRLR